jgi:hypothetical protein
VNFTREPIIETVITPREGCKLVVRNSKGNGQEDYYVDAIEVVSFGHSFFFRSLERPKSFLVPVSDYEILELRETRMVLKNATSEKSIKIGGGRDAPPRPSREPQEERPREEAPTEATASPEGQPVDRQHDRKRDRRRRGRRGGRDRSQPEMREQHQSSSDTAPIEGIELSEGPALQEEPKAPSFISKLFPPPSTLIKETIGRYKTTESIEEEVFPSTEEKPIDESLFDKHTPEEDLPQDDETKFEE